MALFQRWHYNPLEESATREQLLKRVRQLANVANKRVKTLQKAFKKGKLVEDQTAVFRYEQAVERFQQYTGRKFSYISTGEKIYSDVSKRQLKTLERDLLRYLEAKGSTAQGALEVEAKRRSTLKEDYGLDIDKLGPQKTAMIFNALHYLQSVNYKAYSSAQVLIDIVNATETSRDGSLKELQNAILAMYPDDEHTLELLDAITPRVVYRSKHTKKKDIKKYVKVNRPKNRGVDL